MKQTIRDWQHSRAASAKKKPKLTGGDRWTTQGKDTKEKTSRKCLFFCFAAKQQANVASGAATGLAD